LYTGTQSVPKKTVFHAPLALSMFRLLTLLLALKATGHRPALTISP
jgi:hypothetical protein